MDYARYVERFNQGDDAGLVDEFFTDDAVMHTAERLVDGKAELRQFLAWAHDGVREMLRPQHVAEADGQILAEVDIDFFALRDRADFPFQPLKRGQTITAKFFVVYTLRGDKVCRLKTSRWPVGRATSPPPDYSALLG